MKPFQRLIGLGLIALASALAGGCRTYSMVREPLTTAEVIQMAKEGRTPEEIIKRIRDSRTVYVLHARDVKDLLDKGVPEAVVDEMLETRLRDLANYYRGYYYAPYPYFYGPTLGFSYGFWP